MKRLAAFLVSCALISPASAQVIQTGNVTPGHAAMWAADGVVQDAGTAAQGFLTSIGVTNNGGPGVCVNSDVITNAYNQVCLATSTTGGAQITTQNFNGATAAGITFVLNGTTSSLALVQGTTPSGDAACFTATNGVLVDCGGVPGIVAGSNTQIQFNNSGALGASANLTWVSPKLTIGVAGSATGQIGLTGSTSGTITIQGQAAAGTYNFNLPTAAGTSGQPLLSAGGGASAQTYGTLGVPAGGSGQVTLTNHGVLVGAGTSAITQLAAAAAGTVLTGQGATSDPAFSATPTLGVAGTTLGTLGFAGNTSGLVTIQPQAAAGTYNFNLPTGAGTANQVLTSQGGGATAQSYQNIASLLTQGTGITITGTTNATIALTTPVSLANGGTNAALTASNGGLVYSTASALAILSGTATANQIPLSGSNAAPAWSTTTWPNTVTASNLLYANGANTIAGLATANRGVLNTDGSGVPSITATPTLGVNGGTGGQVTFNGATSGSVAMRVAAAAGTSIVFQLPSSNGTNGQVLSTDGAGVLSWISSSGSGTVTSVATSGCATGGPITTTGTIAVTPATNANIWAAGANNCIDAAGANSALGLTTLTDGATITVDMSLFVNATVTLAGNRTLGNPSNTQVGRCGTIWVVQDGTGSRTLAYSANWKFVGGTAPVLSTAASSVDMLSYCVRTSTFIAAALNKAWQ